MTGFWFWVWLVSTIVILGISLVIMYNAAHDYHGFNKYADSGTEEDRKIIKQALIGVLVSPLGIFIIPVAAAVGLVMLVWKGISTLTKKIWYAGVLIIDALQGKPRRNRKAIPEPEYDYY